MSFEVCAARRGLRFRRPGRPRAVDRRLPGREPDSGPGGDSFYDAPGVRVRQASAACGCDQVIIVGQVAADPP